MLALAGTATVRRIIESGTPRDKRRLLQLVQDYGSLIQSFEGMYHASVSECGKMIPLEAGNEDIVADAVMKLVFTKLSSKCSPSNSRRFSHLLKKLLQVVGGICAHLSSAGSRVAKSRDPEKTKRFIVAASSLEDFSIASCDKASVVVESSVDYLRVTNDFDALVRQRLRNLKEVWKVDAIVSTKSFGGRAILFAEQLGLELFFCPDQTQVDRLCCAFEIIPLDCYELSQRNFTGAECQLVVMSKNSTLLLNARRPPPDRVNRCCEPSMKTILLCSPNASSCAQNSRFLRESVNLVAGAVEGNRQKEAFMKIVPGGCAIEKLLLHQIEGCLSGCAGSKLFGLELLREMVKDQLTWCYNNASGSGSRKAKKELLTNLLDTSSTSACVLDLRNCGGRVLNRKHNPLLLGIVHSAKAYREAYQSALQLVYQVLRLSPLAATR
ncbi:hypothetical protein HOP50_14g73060 [Chloropicon primus]|nr:hypothetical protein HOP50_14g73060 [Chloropicon primus]